VKWAVVVVVLVDQMVVLEYRPRTMPVHTHRVLAVATAEVVLDLFNHTVLNEAGQVMGVLCVSSGLVVLPILAELGHQHALPIYNT
jgi:hypothetical protein